MSNAKVIQALEHLFDDFERGALPLEEFVNGVSSCVEALEGVEYHENNKAPRDLVDDLRFMNGFKDDPNPENRQIYSDEKFAATREKLKKWFERLKKEQRLE